MFQGVSYNIDTVFQWKNGKEKLEEQKKKKKEELYSYC